MKRWLAFAPLVVLAALAVLFVGFSLHRNPQVQPKALVGRPLPDLTLPSLTDAAAAIRLREAARGAAGQPVLVNIFASWCVPCVEENAALVALKADGVKIVGVAWKDPPEQTKAFLARNGDPYAAVLVDRSGRAGIDLGVSGAPETYLVGANGLILAKYTGPLDAQSAETLLEKAR